MFNIHKKTQELYKADGGKHQLFRFLDVESDDGNDDIREEYIDRALSLRGDYSKKKWSLELRHKGLSNIADCI